MNNKSFQHRRNFIKQVVKGGIVASATSTIPNFDLLAGTSAIKDFSDINANDQIQVGMIGLGIMGYNNAATLSKVDGIKIVAACDLYLGRLNHAKEVFGKDIFTTTNYLDIINRKDIDAVVISTTDHWHDKISIAALAAGKHVYCEKPMVHQLDEGHAVIEAQNKYKKVFQVGSQRVSSRTYAKAKEIFESGTLGQLILADINYDRHSALGAWQYSIPLDASKETVNWDKFLGDAPKVDYDPKRFFWWRNYRDYGTGVAGDLFVHLFSGLHLITSSLGPERIYATGGLRYWKDGRDVPDVTLGAYDYPETDKHPAFNVQMRTNFVDGGGGGSSIRLVGSEGVMTLRNRSIEVKHNAISNAPGYGGWDSFSTFDKKNRDEFEAWYKEKYGHVKSGPQKEDIIFNSPQGSNDHLLHMENFVAGIRENKKIVEDATFGLRAAGPALASNLSYFEQKAIKWDPVNMKVI